eukprot:scaffold1495_cov362-Pavlova_lutheri.AAC.2
MDYEVQQVDIKTAFLNAELNEDIYIRIPEGLRDEQELNKQPNLVLKLEKSLYGLKQAPRMCYQHLSKTLKREQGFQCNPVDDTILKYKHHKTGKECFILIYVDDLLVAAQDIDTICSHYDARDLGTASFFCGMKISRDRNKRLIYLSEPNKIQKLISQFNTQDCKAKNIPLDVVLSAKNDGELCDTTEYQVLVGSLLYLSTTTRPDLCQAASQLSRFMANPTRTHLKEAQGVLKYLKAIVNYGLCLGSRLDILPDDIEFVPDKQTRKSRTWYILLFNGNLLSWQSKLQSTVSTSTTMPKYQSASSAVEEALWLNNLLSDLTGGNLSKQVVTYCDNQECIKILENNHRMQKTKHIDVAHHFVRERVMSGDFMFRYCESAEMLADYVTKNSNQETFWRCITRLGVVQMNARDSTN